jgi:hypothetical protein
MKEGTISVKIRGQEDDWAQNDRQHIFGPFQNGTVAVVVAKKADRTLEVKFASEHFGHTFSGPMPEVVGKEPLPIAVIWDEKKITLWVKGAKVSSAPFNPVAH